MGASYELLHILGFEIFDYVIEELFVHAVLILYFVGQTFLNQYVRKDAFELANTPQLFVLRLGNLQ